MEFCSAQSSSTKLNFRRFCASVRETVTESSCEHVVVVAAKKNPEVVFRKGCTIKEECPDTFILKSLLSRTLVRAA